MTLFERIASFTDVYIFFYDIFPRLRKILFSVEGSLLISPTIESVTFLSLPSSSISSLFQGISFTSLLLMSF